MRTFQQIIADAEFETRSYSGRSMYGKECVGVDLESTRIGVFFARVLEALGGTSGEGVNEDEHALVIEAFEGMCQDQMGRGIIVYFPSVPVEEA